MIPVALRIKTNILDLAPWLPFLFPWNLQVFFTLLSQTLVSCSFNRWFFHPLPWLRIFTCSLPSVFFSPISILNPNSSLSLRHHFSRKAFLVTAAEIQSLWWLLSLSRDYNYTLIWTWVFIWWISFLSDTRSHQARASVLFTTVLETLAPYWNIW